MADVDVDLLGGKLKYPLSLENRHIDSQLLDDEATRLSTDWLIISSAGISATARTRLSR